MSHLPELLGRGLQSDLADLVDRYFWSPPDASIEQLDSRHEQADDDKLSLALADLRAGESDQAVDRLNAACHKDPGNLAVRLALAIAYDQKRLLPQAIEQLEFAEQARPGEPPILFAMGFCSEKIGLTSQAAEFYRRVTAQGLSFLPAHQRLAAVAVFGDGVDEAIGQYQVIRKGYPQESWVRTGLAELYYRAGRYQDAIEEFQSAIVMEPESWALNDDEVESLVEDGRIGEAIDRLHSLIEAQGPFADLHVRLGDLYSQSSSDDEAMKHYLAALELQPTYLEGTVKLGTHHLICGRCEQAAELFHQAADLNDKVLMNYVGLGVAQVAAGNMVAARGNFDLAVAIEPNSTLLLSELAGLQLKAVAVDQLAREIPSAHRQSFVKVQLDRESLLTRQIERHGEEVQRHPARAGLRYRYGVLLLSQGRQRDAMEQFAAAAQSSPSYGQAVIRLGLAQQGLGYADEAIETFKQAFDLRPESIELHYRLGLLHTDPTYFRQVLEQVTADADGAPDGDDIRANLALSLQNMGLMDRPAATWRSLWKMHQTRGQ